MAAPAQTGAEVEERQFVIQIPELAQEPLLSHVTADTGMTIQGLDTEAPVMHLGAYVLHGTFVEDLGDTLLLDRSDDQAVASAALQQGTPVPFSTLGAQKSHGTIVFTLSRPEPGLAAALRNKLTHAAASSDP